MADFARQRDERSSSAAPTPWPRQAGSTAMRPMWPSGSSRPQPIALAVGVLRERVPALRVEAVPFERSRHVLLHDEHLMPERTQRALVRAASRRAAR